MAGTTTHPTAYRTTVADAVTTALGTTAKLVFRTSGNANAPGTEVATLDLPNPVFGAATAGVTVVKVYLQDDPSICRCININTGPPIDIDKIIVTSRPTVALTPNSQQRFTAKAFNQLLLTLILALILTYAVMASQYESLKDPFIIMFSVPLAGIGVVGTLLLTGTTFSLQAYIGVIMLAGIVVNNAILLVDYTNVLRRRDGLPLRDAVELAGRTRLRRGLCAWRRVSRRRSSTPTSATCAKPGTRAWMPSMPMPSKGSSPTCTIACRPSAICSP